MAELLDVWLTGGIIYSGGSLGHDGGHDDIGRSGHGRLVQQHVAAAQPFGSDFVDVAAADMAEVRTEIAEAEEMGVQTAAADLVTAGFGDDGLAEAGQQGAYHEHRAAK